MELLISSLFFTIFAIWLVDYVENRISDIKMWWEHKQYAKKKRKKITDKIKLRKTWFKTTITITHHGKTKENTEIVDYCGRERDYDNMPENLPETATEYSYIIKNKRNYSKSKIHTVKIKRYYTKDYQ